MKLLARLSAIFGPPRDRPEHLAQVMAHEWLQALGHLPLETLNDAAGKAIRTLRFWPAPSEIIALACEDAAGLRAELEHAELMARQRPSLQVTRGAGDECAAPLVRDAAALASVTRLCAEWRKRVGQSESAFDRMDEWAPASQGGASEALKQSRLVRGVPIP